MQTAEICRLHSISALTGDDDDPSPRTPPQITSPSSDGRAEIDGSQTAFTSDRARDLATTLNYGPLPVPFNTSQPEAVAPKPNSTGPWHSRPPIGLVITALAVAIILLGLQVYLYRTTDRRLRAGDRA